MIKFEFIPKETLQDEQELHLLCDLVFGDGPVPTILEIGTRNGGTAFIWGQLASRRVVCVDKAFGFKGVPPLYRRMKTKVPIVEIVGDSGNLSTFSKVKETLADGLARLLFIDGDHSYRGSKGDFETYSALVEEGGWIALHDIVGQRKDPRIEVYRFWGEIRTRFDSWEFIGKEKNRGIGLIRWRTRA
jgi:cephalosporin hydroxylase